MDRFFREFDRFFDDDFFNNFFNSGMNKRRIGNYDSNDLDPDSPNYKKEEGENEDGSKWVTETYRDGNSFVTRTYITRSYGEEKDPGNIEVTKEDLQRKLDLAVKEERYEDAAKLRDQIKDM